MTTTDAFKDIEKLETDLWEAADNLRANSKLTSSDYFMPVLGVIFLRHAANRFDAAHRQIEADRASGKMPKRKVLPADYLARRALYLPEVARYDWIMQQAAVSGADLPKLVTAAMTAIEGEFEARRIVRHLSVAPDHARQERELPEVGTLADCSRKGFSGSHLPVSYTHLTLPTILRV